MGGVTHFVLVRYRGDKFCMCRGGDKLVMGGGHTFCICQGV